MRLVLQHHTGFVPLCWVIASLVLDQHWSPHFQHFQVSSPLAPLLVVSLPLQCQGSLPVLLRDDPVLGWLILVWEAGDEVSHCPAEHRLCGGSPTVLHWSIPELHHSSHEPVGVQSAPRPNVFPQ